MHGQLINTVQSYDIAGQWSAGGASYLAGVSEGAANLRVSVAPLASLCKTLT